MVMGATPNGVTRAIQVLQFVYAAMPSQVRLILAESLLSWAAKAKDQALAELAGGPRASTAPDFQPITPHDFQTEGRSRPY